MPASVTATKAPEIDMSSLGLVKNWQLVVGELAMRGIDLYAPAVLARPWPGVRAAIHMVIESPTLLRAALTRR